MNFEPLLNKYRRKLKQKFELVPVVGCELEFYTNYPLDLFVRELNLDVVHEEGYNQAEIRFPHTTNVSEIVASIELTKKAIKAIAKKDGSWATFEAKPFVDQPGSAMQIHLNFLDHGKLEEGSTPHYLNLAIGGLLHTLPDCMPLFAPTKNSYKRYVAASMTTPTTISWGRNNRTAAIRIVSDYGRVKRIEHRVPCANANALKVCAAIIFGAYLGIKHKIKPPAETHGLAFSECYNLQSFLSPKLPTAELLQKLKQY